MIPKLLRSLADLFLDLRLSPLQVIPLLHPGVVVLLRETHEVYLYLAKILLCGISTRRPLQFSSEALGSL